MDARTRIETHIRRAGFAIFEAALENIFITDPEGRIVYFNPAAEESTGYSLQEMIGRNIDVFYRDKDLSAGVLAEIRTSKTSRVYEAAIMDKIGRERLFSIKKSPLLGPENRLIGLMAVSRDITDERLYMEELRDLKEFNEAILNSVHDLVVVTDTAGRITYYNPRAEEVTGRSLAEVQGRPISEFYKDPELSEQKLEYIRTTGRANAYQAVILTKEGEERTLEVNKAPLYDAGGELIGLAAISRDITRRHQAEERVRQLQDFLAENSLLGLSSDLLNTRVSEIMTDNPPFCRPEEIVAQAAEKLIRFDLPALPVVGAVRDILGLVTWKDLVEKGLFQGVDLTAPVRAVINSDYISVGPDTYFFDALGAMVRGRSPLLLVAEGGHLRGLVTMNDLLRLRGVAVINVLEGIEEQSTLAGLAGFRIEVDRILQSLIVDGALASQVTTIITEFNDRITRRVVALCQQKQGRPPAGFTWLGLGSEGRKEQTLTTDQDNALVFEDRADPSYFTALAGEVVKGLDLCGFKLCSGGVMADRPKWFGSLGDWIKRLETWAGDPTPERTRDMIMFLDFRRIYGSRDLADDLRGHLNRIFKENPNLLTPIAEDALSKGPPLGLFKGFLVEKSGEYKGGLNLKTRGVLILVDGLRVLAVKHGLFETNTLERLAGLTGQGVFTPAEAASIREAYQTLMGLRLKTNLKALHGHTRPNNYLNPDLLPRWHQQRLKEALIVADELQKKLRQEFWWVK